MKGGTIRALTLEDANCRFSSSSAADFASIPASLKPDSGSVLHHMTDPMINRALRGYQTYLCFQALIQNTEAAVFRLWAFAHSSTDNSLIIQPHENCSRPQIVCLKLARIFSKSRITQVETYPGVAFMRLSKILIRSLPFMTRYWRIGNDVVWW